MEKIQVYFNNKLISDGTYLDFETSQQIPIIKIKNPDPTKLYTIIVADPDAPTRSNPIYKYMLHYLKINNNEIVFDYMPPHPPKGSGIHRYYVLLLSQKNFIKKSDLNLTQRIINNDRSKFNLGEFIENNNLTIVDSVHFKTQNN